MQLNIESEDNTVSQDVTTQDETIEEEEFEQYYQSEPALSNSEDPSIGLGIDWDSDELWERRFMQ